MAVIDLRSDTVTRPGPAMRLAMAQAEVGDDVFGDDPTVERLQAAAAERFGKEAALFVPSGTMANQIALLCWCRPADHVITPRGAHVVHYELGAGAALAGVQFTELGRDGRYDDLDALVDAIQPPDSHGPPTRLVTLESSHNLCGGRIVPIEHLRQVRAVCDAHGLPLHLDGARIFNAIVAAGQDPLELGACVDSLGFCLSKGLGAPVGSLLLGSRAFIQKARRFRKMLGGAMRQVGILAAAGLYALEHQVERLADDHARARALAEGLGALDGVRVAPVETNIVLFELDPECAAVDARTFVARCAEQGLLCYATSPRQVRWVTHLDLPEDAAERALGIAACVLSP